MATVNELPAWARDLPKHLAVDIVDGRPVVRQVYTGEIFWDSDCLYCQHRQALTEIFPDHEAGSGCESGGQAHCTCDRCF